MKKINFTLIAFALLCSCGDELIAVSEDKVPEKEIDEFIEEPEIKEDTSKSIEPEKYPIDFSVNVEDYKEQ